jgi:hypothetical protein
MHVCNPWCDDQVHAVLATMPQIERAGELSQFLGPALASAVGLDPVGIPFLISAVGLPGNPGSPPGHYRQRLVQWARRREG